MRHFYLVQVLILLRLRRNNETTTVGKVNKTIQNFLGKNQGLKYTFRIRRILNESKRAEDFHCYQTLGAFAKFKNAKMTLPRDVECNFSKYKNILKPNRRSFIF